MKGAGAAASSLSVRERKRRASGSTCGPWGEEVAEAMAVEQREPSEPRGSRLVLLVVLRDGRALDAHLVAKIRETLATRCSRAHVPGLVLPATELPVTHNGKRAERAARDAVNGDPVANLEALRNPGCIEAIRAALAAAKTHRS